MLQAVRPAAVAGTFYPGSSGELGRMVDALLAGARAGDGPRPKAIVAPHAGYVYSGPIAASAFALLSRPGPPIETVVLVGPAHRAYVDGLATPDAAAMDTPLGRVEIDADALAKVPQVRGDRAAHAREHSLEVELPFLQRVAPGAKVVPFAVGDASADEVGGVLEALWGGPETVIVVSSDLSHYLPYDVARALDARTAERIVALAPAPLDPELACGARGIDGLLAVARRRGLAAELVDLRCSGDTAGDRAAVVGYGAFAFYEPREEAAMHLDDDRGQELAKYARESIAEALGGPPATRPAGAWADAPGATFVTLRREGALHGCIGTIEPRRALADDVGRNAVAAALRDPRAPHIDLADVDDLSVEVSVLSPLSPIAFDDEASAIAALVPGVDGVVLRWRGRQGTFLPQVWRDLPDPRLFLRELKQKAGLPADFWATDVRLSRYGMEKFSDAPASADEASN